MIINFKFQHVILDQVLSQELPSWFWWLFSGYIRECPCLLRNNKVFMGQRRIVSVNFIYAEGEYDKCDKVLIFVESSERKMEILYTLLAALLYLKIRVREKTPKIREKRKRERCPEYNQILPLLFHRPPDTLDHLSSVHWHLPKREQCLSSPLHFERTDCWLLCSPDTV